MFFLSVPIFLRRMHSLVIYCTLLIVTVYTICAANGSLKKLVYCNDIVLVLLMVIHSLACTYFLCY